MAGGNSSDGGGQRATTRIEYRTKLAELEKLRLENAGLRLDQQIQSAEALATSNEKLQAGLTSAVPKLSGIADSGLTVQADYVFRSAETVGQAVVSAVAQLAQKILEDAKGRLIIITDDQKYSWNSAAYRELTLEMAFLTKTLRDAKERADAKLKPPSTVRPVAIAPGIALAGLGMAAGAVTEIASLFRTDVTIGGRSQDVSSIKVHAQLAGALIGAGEKVRVESISPIGATNPVIDALNELVSAYSDLANSRAKLEARISKLEDTDEALEDELELVAAAIDSLLSRTQTFVTRATTPSTDGISPVRAAAVRSAALGIDDSEKPLVVIIATTKVASEQLTVKRKLRAPRIAVRSYAEVEYFILDQLVLTSSGWAVGTASFSQTLKHEPKDWTVSRPASIGRLTPASRSDH